MQHLISSKISGDPNTNLYCVGKYTLVMEIVDILVRLIDVTTDRFHLQDVGICEFSVKNRNQDNALEIVSVSIISQLLPPSPW